MTLVAVAFTVLLVLTPASALPQQPSGQSSSPPASLRPAGKGALMRYGVRWLDQNTKFFGATFNVSLADAVRQDNWSLFFQFNSEDVSVMEYWGSWRMKQYTAGRYQILPDDMVPDASGMMYFSFNGFYRDAASARGLESLLIKTASVDLNNGQTVIDLSTADGSLASVPVSTQIPNQPFGRFLRSNTSGNMRQIGNTSAENSRASGDKKKHEKEEGSMLGLYITVGMIGAFVLVVGMATMARLRSRKRYRETKHQRDAMRRMEVSEVMLDYDAGATAPVTAARPRHEDLLQHPPQSARYSRAPPILRHTGPTPPAKTAPIATPTLPPYGLIDEYLPSPNADRSLLLSPNMPSYERCTVLGQPPPRKGSNQSSGHLGATTTSTIDGFGASFLGHQDANNQQRSFVSRTTNHR
ncbi:hypothetical protein THASP1DRAFT_21918 [Thamnocephalis sphaerospora]|uniref:Uncharacterized protein n=1 Tax=Thamnocephalis sphaerospora TaxID=78915 RepID=A0A4P9XY72_9FUNG|nr:hypothetical protein THASP1DRAFT_21918 [Thamnocephalis sphaerospora]|eukprot:RKP10370.1 hypothetical protein THASP1DRAFT_21918 [Thamnocephalis sphaerospora]